MIMKPNPGGLLLQATLQCLWCRHGDSNNKWFRVLGLRVSQQQAIRISVLLQWLRRSHTAPMVVTFMISQLFLSGAALLSKHFSNDWLQSALQNQFLFQVRLGPTAEARPSLQELHVAS